MPCCGGKINLPQYTAVALSQVLQLFHYDLTKADNIFDTNRSLGNMYRGWGMNALTCQALVSSQLSYNIGRFSCLMEKGVIKNLLCNVPVWVAFA